MSCCLARLSAVSWRLEPRFNTLRGIWICGRDRSSSRLPHHREGFWGTQKTLCVGRMTADQKSLIHSQTFPINSRGNADASSLTCLLVTDLINGSCGSCVGRVQHTDRVHQLLDRDGRVIDLSLRDQIVQNRRRSILHLIDVDAGVPARQRSAHRRKEDRRRLPARASFADRSRPPTSSTDRCNDLALSKTSERGRVLVQPDGANAG